MQARTDWLQRRRAEAWAFGRGLRNDLLAKYGQQYGVLEPPPPATIVDELLTDFLDVTLRFEPLGADRFAETRVVGGRTIVTINSQVADIEGVKDPDGVQNVAKWHEAVHAVCDLDILSCGEQPGLPGLELPSQIVCYRSMDHVASAVEREREMWAEEAGRAAAVSMHALSKSRAFQQLVEKPRSNSRAWSLLYQAAADIGVNISALVKQLQLEGLVVVTREDGRQRLYVQPTLAIRLKEGEG